MTKTMTMKVRSAELVVEYSRQQAEAALADGDGDRALEWLGIVTPEPRVLLGACHYQAAKQAAARGDWNACQGHLCAANESDSRPLYQQRLALVRKRRPGLHDTAWATMSAKIAPAERLPCDWLNPPVTEVWAGGAYYSRGVGQTFPWTRILRGAKRPGEDAEEHEAMVELASKFLCRFVAERTDLLRTVDFVVPIPPNPVRYAGRLMSLPDRIARAVEEYLAIPAVLGGLQYLKPELELRGLTWAARRAAIEGAFGPGDLNSTRGRTVLLVDDVITSGATLSEAAWVLREAGVADVVAAVVAHTEG
jgi:hypothetical protein